MKRLGLALAAAVLAVGSVACGGDDTELNPPGGDNGGENGGGEGEEGGEEGEEGGDE